jgi:hypothetical protein
MGKQGQIKIGENLEIGEFWDLAPDPKNPPRRVSGISRFPGFRHFGILGISDSGTEGYPLMDSGDFWNLHKTRKRVIFH